MNNNRGATPTTRIEPVENISHLQDIETIFQVTTQELRQVLKCDRSIIYQFNRDWTGQIVAESVAKGWISLLVGQEKDTLIQSQQTQCDRCIVRNWSQGDITETDSFLQQTKGGEYALGQKFTAIADIYQMGFSDCYLRSLEKYQAKAYLIVPIFQRGQLWGLLAAYQNDRTRIWQEIEINLTIQIAERLAVSLQQAEYINKLQQQTESLQKTVRELQLTQQQLIQQEKLAALGQLVAGIAHEINTPLGAIRAAAGNNTKAVLAAIAELPKLGQYLNKQEKLVFFRLLDAALMSKPLLSSSEKRTLKRKIIKELKAEEIDNARTVADILIDIGVSHNISAFLVLFKHERVNWILDLAYNLTRLLSNNQTIITAVEKASKVVFALKNYAHFDSSGRKQLVRVEDGLETVLELYHNKLKQNIDVIRKYQNTRQIWCYPDELIQVWTNLIHNSIQAMKEGGELLISTALQGEGVAINISDSGCGIPPQIQNKIFEPFFTTKPIGEGSGLGLHISQKIIDKHQGTIAISSKPGQTRCIIWLPISKKS